MVYKLAQRYSSAFGVDIDDLFSEGLIITNNCITKYNPEQQIPFGNYLQKNVARGLAGYARREYKRRAHFVQDVVGDDGSWLESITADETSDPEQVMFQVALQEKMPRLLNRFVTNRWLTEELLIALKMKYGVGNRVYTNDEIDRHFGKRSGWARVTLSRALGSLSKKMKGKELEDFLE